MSASDISRREPVVAEVFLRRLSRWQAEDQSAELASLHADAYGAVRGPERVAAEQDFHRRFAEHLQQSEFELVTANDPALVGCAYGFLIERDGSWWDRFAVVPRELAELTDVLGSRQLFVLAGLMVRPSRRRHGVGGRLVDQVLSRTAAPLAVVLLEAERQEPRQAFGSWGWENTGDLTPRGEGKPLEAWTLRIRR